MPFIGIAAIAKSGMYTVCARLPFFIDGDESDLEILSVPVLLHNTPYPFFTGFLWRFSLAHELYDQEAAHGTYHFFPYARSGSPPHGIIYKKSGSYNGRIPDPTGHFVSHATCCTGTGDITIFVYGQHPDSVVVLYI